MFQHILQLFLFAILLVFIELGENSVNTKIDLQTISKFRENDILLQSSSMLLPQESMICMCPFEEVIESVPLPLYSYLLVKVCISAHSNISSFVIKSFIIKLSHFPGQILQLTMAAFTVISSTYSDEMAPYFSRVSEEVDLVDVCPCQFL